MGSLERRVESLEDARMRGKAQLVREALQHFTDEELEAAEEFLDAEAARGDREPPPTNELLDEIWEEIKRWEAARP